MNYKTDVFENDLVLSLCLFPTFCKDHDMKEICVVVGAKKCTVSPESFSSRDKHTAAMVNKIQGKEWDTFDTHEGFPPLNEQRSNKLGVSEVPHSLKQWSINLEQILFLLQGYYFNFYAWVKREMWRANYENINTKHTGKLCLSSNLSITKCIRYSSLSCHLIYHPTLQLPLKISFISEWKSNFPWIYNLQ